MPTPRWHHRETSGYGVGVPGCRIWDSGHIHQFHFTLDQEQGKDLSECESASNASNANASNICYTETGILEVVCQYYWVHLCRSYVAPMAVGLPHQYFSTAWLYSSGRVWPTGCFLAAQLWWFSREVFPLHYCGTEYTCIELRHTIVTP